MDLNQTNQKIEDIINDIEKLKTEKKFKLKYNSMLLTRRHRLSKDLMKCRNHIVFLKKLKKV